MRASRFLNLACAVIAVALSAGVARAEIKTQWVEYKEGNTPLRGYLAYDDAIIGKRPGVLLAHDRAGMSEVALKDAAMIAKLGYVVFVGDIYGKDVLPKTIPEMTEQTVIYNKDRPLMRARATAGFDVLKANPMVDAAKIAVIGYCFGGTVGVELAETGVPIVGLISVHGSFRNFTPEAAKNIKGRVLILHGAEDPVAPLEEVNTLISHLRAAKVDWQLRGLLRLAARLHQAAERLGGARRPRVQGRDDAVLPRGVRPGRGAEVGRRVAPSQPCVRLGFPALPLPRKRERGALRSRTEAQFAPHVAAQTLSRLRGRVGRGRGGFNACEQEQELPLLLIAMTVIGLGRAIAYCNETNRRSPYLQAGPSPRR